MAWGSFAFAIAMVVAQAVDQVLRGARNEYVKPGFLTVDSPWVCEGGGSETMDACVSNVLNNQGVGGHGGTTSRVLDSPGI